MAVQTPKERVGSDEANSIGPISLGYRADYDLNRVLRVECVWTELGLGFWHSSLRISYHLCTHWFAREAETEVERSTRRKETTRVESGPN